MRYLNVSVPSSAWVALLTTKPPWSAWARWCRWRPLNTTWSVPLLQGSLTESPSRADTVNLDTAAAAALPTRH